jgi:hypothetical protein
MNGLPSAPEGQGRIWGRSDNLRFSHCGLVCKGEVDTIPGRLLKKIKAGSAGRVHAYFARMGARPSPAERACPLFACDRSQAA